MLTKYKGKLPSIESIGLDGHGEFVSESRLGSLQSVSHCGVLAKWHCSSWRVGWVQLEWSCAEFCVKVKTKLCSLNRKCIFTEMKGTVVKNKIDKKSNFAIIGIFIERNIVDVKLNNQRTKKPI